MTVEQQDAFLESYLTTASWITCDSDENNEFTKDARLKASKDCLKFIIDVQFEFGVEKGNELLTLKGSDVTYRSGHDFFLTRNGHGAGFWDNPDFYGSQEIADKLTEIAERQGEVDCYHIEGKKSKLTF